MLALALATTLLTQYESYHGYIDDGYTIHSVMINPSSHIVDFKYTQPATPEFGLNVKIVYYMPIDSPDDDQVPYFDKVTIIGRLYGGEEYSFNFQYKDRNRNPNVQTIRDP
jgi:hypothetical protein